MNAIAIGLGAFLLFQVQPLLARAILPWFGGLPAVWTTALVFFQAVLLLGYLYADWATRRLAPRTQAIVHVGLLAASLVFLPILPSPDFRPADSTAPALRILLLLAATVGVPYLLLSATSPLLSAWCARTAGARMPYRLYAISNLGSILALVTYPTLVEPALPTRTQAHVWSAGYAAFAILVALLAVRAARSLAPAPEAPPAPSPGLSARLVWVGLGAVPSALLVAVTTHLTQRVASVPFLWVLPLCLYLATFIVCFGHEGVYAALRRPFLLAGVGAVVAMTWALAGRMEGARSAIALFCAGLFACCIVFHGELVRKKPAPRDLTAFYLMTSLGGMLGGLFSGVLAPHTFGGPWELPLLLCASGGVALGALAADLGRSVAGRSRTLGRLAAALAFLVLVGGLAEGTRRSVGSARLLVRSFWGFLEVDEWKLERPPTTVRALRNASIVHGIQDLAPGRHNVPNAYFGPRTGVGLAFTNLFGEGPRKVGVLGLGAGALATWARAGDTWRFYEINPQVVDVARAEFTFLADCPAPFEVVLGDGRLSLEREPPQRFDLLVMDAFNGGSVPVHLLTREALDVYLRHLAPDGVLAIQLTSLWFDLAPVVRQSAEGPGREIVLIESDRDDDALEFPTTWVLVATRPGRLAHPAIAGAAEPIVVPAGRRPWTDEDSSLFAALR